MISSSKIDRTALWRISLLLSIVGFLLCYGAFYLANKLSAENIKSQLLTIDQSNKHIGLIVQENAEKVIANADTVLRFMQRDVELYGKILPEHEPILREFCQRRFVGNTAVFDQAGELQFTIKRRLPGKPSNVATTDVFMEQLKFSPGVLYIGSGWVSLSSDRSVVFLSRQIRSPQGEFKGIVTVTLAQDYLAKFDENLGFDHNHKIFLLRRDGMVLAQAPQQDTDETAGVSLQQTRRVEEYLSRGITAAIYDDTESGAERREFFTILREYPLLVMVSSLPGSADTLPVQIQQQYRFFAQGFSVFVLLSGVLLWWQIRRQYMFAEQLQQKQWQLEQLSYHDQLTGVKNRHYLDEIIAGEMARADRYKQPLSMLIFDLDHFKKVNDTWGHPVGDLVLKHTAEIIGDRIRKADILVRIGGEEFVVLMPETRLAGAREAAESLRAALAANEHPIAGKVTASFGVAERMKIEPFSYWYRRADEALYRAKQGGRNCVVAADESGSLPFEAVRLEWRSEWESGHPLIDEQHQELIALGNKIIYLVLEKSQPEELLPQLELLIEHIRSHFTAEGKILVQAGYPEHLHHGEIHKGLLEKLLICKAEYLAGGLTPTAFFAFIVDEIVVGHMLKEDRKFFPYVRVEQ